MLTHLYIQNYALISRLDLSLSDGFGVITGETGAGKSILLGALNLVLGGRADSKVITEGEQKCVIEAVFDLTDIHIESFFEENELDYECLCTIRRELSATGKSRSFVNDTPVSLSVLKELSTHLIDIHSQHENLLLQDDAFQLGIVDSVAQNASRRAAYHEAYEQYRQTEKQLGALRQEAAQQQADSDYIAFQYNQLSEARLQENELEELEQEEQLLNHAEEIKTGLNAATQLLEAEGEGTLITLKEALAQLRKIEQFLPSEHKLTERLQSAYIELKDIAEEADDIGERTEFDPARMQVVEERLDLLHTLLQKHRKNDIAELIALRDELGSRINRIASYDEDISRLQQQLRKEAETLQTAADRLRQTRLQAQPLIEQTLEKELATLGIRHARIAVEISATQQFLPSGQDDIQFLFAANKNQTLHNVAQASGGEIARLMLCIKALIADKQGLPTIIFDEIDTGVSGEVANRMGEIMQAIGQHRQVISISHLPQIAAKGATHYKVYKQDTDNRTETHMRQLTTAERIEEIAQMLSGESISEAALANARQLLGTTL